jgi:hypothetical protein
MQETSQNQPAQTFYSRTQSMSLPPTASARSTWRPRHLKVPRQNRRLLIEPALAQALTGATENRQRLETAQITLQGRSLPLIRKWSREACLKAAHAYTQSLLDEPTTPPDPDRQPLFVAGHQPELYHPGVWVKNFAIDRLARDSGGLGLNLIVDNDTLGSTSLRVPAGTRSQPIIERIPFAAARPVQPWEDATVVDPATFDSFAERVAARMSEWGIDPLLSDIWPDAVAHRQSSSRLCDCLSAARHRQERRWGLSNLELPISRLCETDPFLWFAAHILAHLPRFQECHNRVLETYRRLNGVRSRNHPVPRLREQEGWLEAPFWVWRAGEANRHGVFVRQVEREVHLSDGTDVFARLPLSPQMDACCAVEVLKELPAQGLRFRTRALTTTLFSRLCLGDLFVHGIGGAKYDEMTDQIIREFYGLEPPQFLTMTATLHLPLAQPYPTTIADRRRIEWLIRDLEFNADRHGMGHTANGLVARKRELIAEQQAAPTTGLSRRQRVARRPDNRRRYRELEEVNARLAELAWPQRIAAENELKQIDQELQANEVLQSREFSFALYPAETLRAFLTDLPATA